MASVYQIAPHPTGGALRDVMAKNIDWKSVKCDYRLGQMSLRAIATKHGTTHTTIRRKIKKYSWVQDRAEEVRLRTQEALLEDNFRRSKIDAKHSKRSRKPINSIEAAAQTNTAVIRTHRKTLRIGQDVIKALLSQLEEFSKKTPIDSKPVRAHAGIVKDLAIAARNLIPLERQAFNMDATTGDDDAPTRIIIEKY